MGKKIYAVDTVYGYRTDTLANWQAENPVLYSGEPVIVSDGKDGDWLKIGDGVTPFNDLPYKRGPQGLRGEQGDQGVPGEKGKDGKDADMSLIANALKGNKSGETISASDVSPIEHNVGVKVKSKNLFQPFIKDYTTTQNGVTIIVEQGKSVVLLNGTATSNTQRALFMSVQNPIELKAGKTYCISAKSISGVVGDCSITLNADTTILKSLKLGNSQVYTPTEDISAYIGVHALSGATFENAEIVWQLEEGTTATTYTPFVEDLTAVSIKKQGKNLLSYPYYNTTKEQNGITFTDNKDGTVTVNGTATANAMFYFIRNGYLPIGTYTSSGMNGCIAKANGTTVYLVPSGTTFTIENEKDLVEYLAFAVISGNTVKNEIVKPMLEEGTTASGYEPFIEPTTYTPNADGTVEGVTSLAPNMTLTTDTSGVVIDAEYNRDINKAFAELQNAIINLGGTL